MVEVLIEEFQGIIENVELYELPIDAENRQVNLILKHYRSWADYNEALDDSNADYIVHIFSKKRVK